MEPESIPIATTANGSPVVFTREERQRHIYVAGKTGSGKSTLMYNLALGDIHAGEGIAFIDPHGDTALDLLDAIPRRRINDVCYLDASDVERPVGFNPATRIAPARRALAAAGIVAAFKHLWSESWGPRLEHFLYHGVVALLSRQHATLIDLPRVYTDDAFRERLLRSVTDPETLRFWHEEFPGYTKSLRSDAIAPILNKAGQIAASPHLRLILGQIAPEARSLIHDEQPAHPDRKSRQRHDRGAGSEPLGIAAGLTHAAHRHGAWSATAARARTVLCVHVDEFQTFSSDAFASLLSEARKFATHFCLANQYTDQLSHAVRSAVIGNAGTLVVFRVGSSDAELLAPEFRSLERGALSDQEPFTAWLRRGAGGHHRIDVEPKLYESLGTRDAIVRQSRQRFGRPRRDIETPIIPKGEAAI